MCSSGTTEQGKQYQTQPLTCCECVFSAPARYLANSFQRALSPTNLRWSCLSRNCKATEQLCEGKGWGRTLV